ncbi:hypothetical protein GYMLUDRAFT_37924 [Collybiopsis luxurians FD-317 M1]|nr:hypothetical protein GYMLUDRAFT_37924 [Collybiopsis luxurians FD-317 M1]
MSLRPKFLPIACAALSSPHAPLSSPDIAWIPLIECPANFPADLFDTAVSQLIHHPEYNSTLILRSDTVSDLTNPSQFPSLPPELDNFTKTRCIHRKLLPRRPGRDASLEQYCTLYKVVEDSSYNTVLILSPIASENDLPYYHPRVSHIAFRYIPTTSAAVSDVDDSDIHSSPSSSDEGIIRIEVVPLSSTPLDPSSRLFRTSLSLLDTLHRYGWGALTNYQKRVIHDVLIPREHYQDLYLVMRERHKGLVDTWQEVTDPLKHVFEDIGIATYLMLLWRDSFEGGSQGEDKLDLKPGEEPWKKWPRPPGGFLDLGCGNGLLTHILVSEGYEGCGFDVRERMSWRAYPSKTQERLHVYAFSPLDIELENEDRCLPDSTSSAPSPTLPDLSSSSAQPVPSSHAPTSPVNMNSNTNSSSDVKSKSNAVSNKFFPPRPGTFIISNHADELTPWTPLLATLYDASGYISIPCCAWDFDGRFERDHKKMELMMGMKISEVNRDREEGGTRQSGENGSAKTIEENKDGDGAEYKKDDLNDADEFIRKLNLGVGAGDLTSGYAMYRIYIAMLSVRMGWEVECETLRIPSTRNWAVVGRKPLSTVSHAEAMENVREIVRNVKERGVFRPRIPEGKGKGRCLNDMH